MCEDKNYLENHTENIPEELAGLFVMVIPAYKPTQAVTDFAERLKEAGYRRILIVNDGSPEEYDGIFEKLEETGCTVIRHAVNLGKGRALKDAVNHIAMNMKESKYIAVLDSNGIQQIEAINEMALRLSENPDAIVMGTRNYKSASVKKSKAFTNMLTRIVMALLCGVSVDDTKTSLRACSVKTALKFITTGGERYDYETNILLESKNKEVKIEEIKVGDENFTNSSSHYNPLVDSFNLYKIFLKYVFVALLCYAVDLGVFRLLMAYLQVISPLYYTIIDTVIARVCSSFVGYMINRKKVFNSKEHSVLTAVKYYTVTTSQMIISALSVWSLQKIWNIDVVVIKMIVDFILFCFGFIAQREWVFKKGKK